jgi:hypothetical protein
VTFFYFLSLKNYVNVQDQTLNADRIWIQLLYISCGPIFFPKTGADIALSIQQSVHILEQPSLQAEDIPDSIRQRHLRAHNARQMFEQLLECSKLLIVDRNDGPLEELVAVDVEFHLFGALLRGHLDEGGAMGTEPPIKK